MANQTVLALEPMWKGRPDSLTIESRPAQTTELQPHPLLVIFRPVLTGAHRLFEAFQPTAR